MKKKTTVPQNAVIAHYDESIISPTIQVDLGSAESYRAAIEQINLSLSEDRALGKLLALQIYSSQGSDSVVTFFMHKEDAYIVGFIDNKNVKQFPSDAELAYKNTETKFSLNDIRPHLETVRMLGFVIAEATRFFPIAEYIELMIEEKKHSFDINAPLHNRKNKFWYIEEPRGAHAINTMTELTMKKLKTSWAASNRYYLKEQVINDFTTPDSVAKTIVGTFSSALEQMSSSVKLLGTIKKDLGINLDFLPLQKSLSQVLNVPNQQTSDELVREAVNSHSEKITQCQSQLQALENMRIEAVTDYENCKLKIESKQKQNKKVSTKLTESEGFYKKLIDSLLSTKIVIEAQLNIHQALFDLTKVAIHTNLAVPYPFHPLPEERKAVVSLNVSNEVAIKTTEETQAKKKGGGKHHKVSNRHSGDDDPDNDKGGERVILDHTCETIEYKAYYSLFDYYFGWIYQLPKWLQDTLLNSRVIKVFIENLKYDSKFVEKSKVLEKDFYVKIYHNQDYEYENDITQKAQVNYDDYIRPFEIITMGTSITVGIIMFSNFIEQKDPLLGLGNNFIELHI